MRLYVFFDYLFHAELDCGLYSVKEFWFYFDVYFVNVRYSEGDRSTQLKYPQDRKKYNIGELRVHIM